MIALGWNNRILLCAWLWLSATTTMVSGQRFMRQGFSNQEDFGAEMKLEDNEAAVDMTREMFLMQDLPWQVDPLKEQLANVDDAKIRQHIQKYLSQPVELTLFKKRGKFGLRAVGKMENGKKLRGFWRQASAASVSSPKQFKTSDFLQISYDDAVRSRLFTVEFELQLPPVAVAQNQKVMPSVIYQVSVESGSMNPKALVPRGRGKVSILPRGRNADDEKTEAGTCRVGVVPMKAGIVDPTWAKGRPIFRKGRKSGLM